MVRLVSTSGVQSAGAQSPDIIAAAGYAVLLASGAAALLPAANFDQGPRIVGALVIVVGLLEILGNALRRGGHLALAAGAVSVGAGILLLGQPVTTFVSTVYVMLGWLLLRGLLLMLAALFGNHEARLATMIAGGVDVFLAGLVWVGLTAGALVIALFGPTSRIIADFAWVVALSFVGAGLLLLKYSGQSQGPGPSGVKGQAPVPD